MRLHMHRKFAEYSCLLQPGYFCFQTFVLSSKNRQECVGRKISVTKGHLNIGELLLLFVVSLLVHSFTNWVESYTFQSYWLSKNIVEGYFLFEVFQQRSDEYNHHGITLYYYYQQCHNISNCPTHNLVNQNNY